MSAFNNLKDIGPLQIWPGLIGRALTGAEATLAQIELEPNIDVPEHSHINEQIGILIGGSMIFRIGGESRDSVRAAPGSSPQTSRIPSRQARTARR
jgi:hypothetical protein